MRRFAVADCGAVVCVGVGFDVFVVVLVSVGLLIKVYI